MYCPKCGKEVKDNDRYCPYCGAKLIKEETREEKEAKLLLREKFTRVMNLILCIASFFVVLMAVIGVFGPTISYSNYDYDSSLEIGGIFWFAYQGWTMLNEGRISIGPFYLTFVLYIFSSIAILAFSGIMLYRSINNVRKNEEFSSYPHFFIILLIHRIYAAVINNFYYEYLENKTTYYEAGSGWGETAFNVAIPFFIIAFIIYFIGKNSFGKNVKKISTSIMILLASMCLIGQFDNLFINLGFRDYNISESVIFGTLHYFDIFMGEAPIEVEINVIITFVLGLLALVTITIYIITTLRKFIKGENINRKLMLVLAILLNVFSFGILVCNIVFGFNINKVPGFYDNAFYLNGALTSLCFMSLFVLGLSIAIFAVNADLVEEAPKVIDQEVEIKEE